MNLWRYFITALDRYTLYFTLIQQNISVFYAHDNICSHLPNTGALILICTYICILFVIMLAYYVDLIYIFLKDPKVQIAGI
jgi:hypothetical protein